jgi:hypothetical protein
LDWNTKATTEVKSILGLVGFKAVFFYPNGRFEITISIKIFTDNKHSKIDDNYAKKLETDALTKALSKLGFNADIFLGKFDDVRYVDEMKEEFNFVAKVKIPSERLKECKTLAELASVFGCLTRTEKTAMESLKDELKLILK